MPLLGLLLVHRDDADFLTGANDTLHSASSLSADLKHEEEEAEGRVSILDLSSRCSPEAHRRSTIFACCTRDIFGSWFLHRFLGWFFTQWLQFTLRLDSSKVKRTTFSTANK